MNLILKLLGSLIPFVALYGYVAKVQWLYLVCAILSVAANLWMVFSGTFNRITIFLLVGTCVVVGTLTDSFWDGVLLGCSGFIGFDNTLALILLLVMAITSRRR